MSLSDLLLFAGNVSEAMAINDKDFNNINNSTAFKALTGVSKTIEASLVYDNKMYYRLYTAYDADSKNLKPKVFKPGMLVNVIKQEQYNFTFRYYYGS